MRQVHGPKDLSNVPWWCCGIHRAIGAEVGSHLLHGQWGDWSHRDLDHWDHLDRRPVLGDFSPQRGHGFFSGHAETNDRGDSFAGKIIEVNEGISSHEADDQSVGEIFIELSLCELLLVNPSRIFFNIDSVEESIGNSGCGHHHVITMPSPSTKPTMFQVALRGLRTDMRGCDFGDACQCNVYIYII